MNIAQIKKSMRSFMKEIKAVFSNPTQTHSIIIKRDTKEHDYLMYLFSEKETFSIEWKEMNCCAIIYKVVSGCPLLMNMRVPPLEMRRVTTFYLRFIP